MMISVAEAEARILELCLPLGGPGGSADGPAGDQGRHLEEGNLEQVPLKQAHGRVLGKAVVATRDVPHWDNSAMDGYAVRSSDCQTSDSQDSDFHDGESSLRPLMIVDEVPAGVDPGQGLQAGRAARIFTGGVLPQGADAVVMQEETERQGDRVWIKATVQPGQFVRKQGAYCRAGTTILPPGTRLGPAELAIAAANQTTQLPVIRRPTVAILSTGNELVSVDQPLKPGQIVDSNRYALTAFVEQMGAIALPLGRVGDQRETVTQAIRQAIAQADIVLSTGGVSVGDYDFVETVLEELGATIAVRKVAIKPGKPLTVAQFSAESLTQLGLDPQGRNRPVVYFGLPGNPVSALVGCWRFVAPALRTIAGRSPQAIPPQFVMATTQTLLRGAGKRDNYLWGTLTPEDTGYHFQSAGGVHQSANLINLAGTTGLAIVPAGTEMIAEGEAVKVMVVQEPG